MADRLTQLQDAINCQADNLCNSIGILQQNARPNSFLEFATFSRSSSTAYEQILSEAGIPLNFDNNSEKFVSLSSDKTNGDTNGNAENDPSLSLEVDHSKQFAKLITKTAKDINLLIDSLPSREIEPELQEAHIRRLDAESAEEAKKLENVIEQAEALLDVIKNALEDIAQNQLRMKQLEALS